MLRGVGESVDTTSASRPLKPGPKPSAIEVGGLARRGADRAGAAPGSASRMSRGRDGERAEADDADEETGTRSRMTAGAQRKPKPVASDASASTRRAGPALAPRQDPRSPAKPSSAGSRVIATSTATATVPAAARPITVRNGMPTTDRPASAMTTVAPAKTTAEPAVPTARPAASSAAEAVERGSAGSAR